MWKRSWIKRRNCQAEEQSGLAEGEAKRKSRRRGKTENQNGLAEGERAKQLEIAKTLIAKGFEKNEIAEITELSIEEIEKMAKDK